MGTAPQFLEDLNIVNEVSMGDLWITYGHTFVIIFSAIETSLVHVLFDTLDLTPLADTLLAYLSGLKGYRERNNRCRPS